MKKYYRSNNKFFSSPIKYTFTEDVLCIENNSEAATGTSQIKYESFYKIYELDDVIYAFINSSQAHVIKKTDFSVESLQSLRNILDSKLGDRYYKFYKDL